MSEIHRRARREQQTLADDAADRFDSELLSDVVHEHVLGHRTDDDPLGQLLDVAEQAYDLQEAPKIEGTSTARAAFKAGETLADHASDVVIEQIARACATVVTDGDEWTDAHGAATVQTAQEEAQAFLAAHPKVTEQVANRGVLPDLIP